MRNPPFEDPVVSLVLASSSDSRQALAVSIDLSSSLMGSTFYAAWLNLTLTPSEMTARPSRHGWGKEPAAAKSDFVDSYMEDGQTGFNETIIKGFISMLSSSDKADLKAYAKQQFNQTRQLPFALSSQLKTGETRLSGCGGAPPRF